MARFDLKYSDVRIYSKAEYMHMNTRQKTKGGHCAMLRVWSDVVLGAAAIRRRRQPLSFKPQSAVKLVASWLSRR